MNPDDYWFLSGTISRLNWLLENKSYPTFSNCNSHVWYESGLEVSLQSSPYVSLWGILPCSLHCLLLGSRLSVNQATAFAMGLRGAFTGCDGFARLMPEISMQMGCWTVWGWLKRFKYRVTCLIRNRRQLGNRKNNMTQRWVLHSLWETTQAWVWAEESLSNGTGYLLRVKLSAVNRLKCIMHVLFFSSCCIYPSISRTHF